MYILELKQAEEQQEHRNKKGEILLKREYGYIRVSSHDQNEDRQLIALKALKIPDTNIYIDKQSGKDFNRKNYQKLIVSTYDKIALK